MSHTAEHLTNAPGDTASERKSNLSAGHVVRGVVRDSDGEVVWSGDWTYSPDDWESKQAFLDNVSRETEAHRDRLDEEQGEPDAEIAVS